MYEGVKRDKNVYLKCTGCGACFNICPMDAIRMEYDDSGFLKPIVNDDKCIRCGRCDDVCPIIKPINNENYDNPSCYAIWANENIRMKSSSGGFFTVLAKYIISKKGCVYGAVWDDNFWCEIVEASEENEIAPMRLSKYVQSKTGDTFKAVEKHLNEESKVAYFGCPCQIAGLKSYLNEKRIRIENLITVDLVCFCVPSNKLFRQYLDEEYGIDNVSDVCFRDKGARGWSPYSYSISLKSGKIIFPDNEDDPYQKAFHGVLARNNVCTNCKFYEFPRQGDFTIGDFWGVEKHDSSWNDGNGTSVVLVNNDRAEAFFEIIKNVLDRFERVPLEWCMNKGNRIGTEARPDHIRKGYFNELIATKGFREAVDRALNGTYDIGCVCMFNQNIGNNLTNFALYRTLRDLGHFVLMIGNPKVDGKSPFGWDEDRFIRFKTCPYESWEIEPLLESRDDLYEIGRKCETYIVGSDQLWRELFLKGTDYFATLDWVGNDKYKLSYATSFATDTFTSDKQEESRFAYLLERFNSISVREETGKRIIRSMIGADVPVVLDPVFLCERSVFEEMANEATIKNIDDRYVSAYFLDKTEKKEKILVEVANKKTCGSYKAATDYLGEQFNKTNIDYMDALSVEEWLLMIKESQYLLTDSFHGLCFALIFHKDFAVVYDVENWRGYTRISNILHMLGLQDRHISEVNDIDRVIDVKIDWDRVESVLSEKRKESLKWLKSELLKAKDYNGKYDVYDEIIRHNINTHNIVKEFKDHENRINHKLKRLRSNLFLNSYVYREMQSASNQRSKEELTVVGFGSGNCFRRNIDKVRSLYDFRIVCDNNPEKWNTSIENGIFCISPHELRNMKDVLVIIMVDDISIAFEIAEQLINMGITRFTHITNWLKAIED